MLFLNIKHLRYPPLCLDTSSRIYTVPNFLLYVYTLPKDSYKDIQQ